MGHTLPMDRTYNFFLNKITRPELDIVKFWGIKSLHILVFRIYIYPSEG